jgi:hypothetical protein
VADDSVFSVRQISQYPLQQSVPPPATFLYQDGVGGPYKSVYGYTLVGTALASGSSDLFIAPNFGLRWNGARLWWDLGSFQFSDRVEAPQFFQDGELVATLPQLEAVAASGVFSVNGRVGDVVLDEFDILRAGGLLQNNPHLHGWATADTPRDLATNDDSIATCLFVQRLVCFALAQTVTSFNGRVGDITLTTADINAAYALPGPPWPSVPNPALGDASNRIASTLFVDESVEDLRQWTLDQIAASMPTTAYAPLNSPNFTGVPTAPTATAGSSTGQIATTAFVAAAVTASTTGVASFNTRTGAVVLTTGDITGAGGAPLASPAFSGNPTAPTPAPGDNDTSLATTAFVHAAITALAAGVTSFNTRTGAVVLTTADVTGVGGAPIASPALSGTPTAPTAAPATNNTQIATTAYVTAAIAALPAPVSSFNGRTGAVTFQANDISAVGGAMLNSPIFTGTPQAPTPIAGTNNTGIATTAFVAAALAAAGGVTSFNGRAGAVTLTAADVTAAGGAPIASPAFTGVPAAPTATAGTNTSQLATTAFVQAALAVAPGGVSSFMGRTGAISLLGADISAAGGALLAGPAFSGNPTAPTQAAATNNTTLATTAFVAAALATAGGVSSFNGRAGAVSLLAADVTGVGGALLAGPAFSGAPTAPTAAPGTNTTQLATTAFANAVAGVQPGNRVLLSTTVISTPVATLDWFTTSMFDGTYDELELVVWNFAPATEAQVLIRCSNDGSTFDSTTSYNTMYTYGSSVGSGAGNGLASSGLVQANNAGVSAPFGYYGRFRFLLVPSGTRGCMCQWQQVLQNSVAAIAVYGGSFYVGSPTLGLRFMVAGNFNLTRGTFKWYGIKK